ncbi:MAG: hypothetical protein ACKPKO_20955, partial [Candidatus Fonsibacter sp.]
VEVWNPHFNHELLDGVKSQALAIFMVGHRIRDFTLQVASQLFLVAAVQDIRSLHVVESALAQTYVEMEQGQGGLTAYPTTEGQYSASAASASLP